MPCGRHNAGRLFFYSHATLAEDRRQKLQIVLAGYSTGTHKCRVDSPLDAAFIDALPVRITGEVQSFNSGAFDVHPLIFRVSPKYACISNSKYHPFHRFSPTPKSGIDKLQHPVNHYIHFLFIMAFAIQNTARHTHSGVCLPARWSAQ